MPFPLKRDFVCRLRLLVDSMPEQIRNSRALFEVAHRLFGVPPSLFYFRERYRAGLIADLNSLYTRHSALSLPQASRDTDINSFHLRLIKDYLRTLPPGSTVMDVGCGSGYLLSCLSRINSTHDYLGIDLCVPDLARADGSKVQYIQGDLLTELEKTQDKSYDLVICAHVLEHLSDPSLVLARLRRIAKKHLIIICPVEKEYRWGLNYHIHFFSTPADLLSLFTEPPLDTSDGTRFSICTRLGDVMAVEHFSIQNKASK